MPGLVTVCHATLCQRLWGQHLSAGASRDSHPTTEPCSPPPMYTVKISTPTLLAQLPPCCSGHSEEQTCSHSRARSSEHPCRARRNGSPAAAHSRCTGSSAHAMSGHHIPASGTLWGTGVPLRGCVELLHDTLCCSRSLHVVVSMHTQRDSHNILHMLTSPKHWTCWPSRY